MQSVYLQRIMKINPIGHLVKTNPIKPNFRQEMPKMPYLPACVKRHYASTVKSMQPVVKIRANSWLFSLDVFGRFGHTQQFALRIWMFGRSKAS